MSSYIDDLSTVGGKFREYKGTKEGQKLIAIALLFFILGVVWKFVFFVLLIMGVVYIVYKYKGDKNERRK